MNNIQVGMKAGNDRGDWLAWYRDARFKPYSRMSVAPRIIVEDDVILNDVSFYQGAINFSQMNDAGSQGTVIRAGQNRWPDNKFEANYANAQGVIPRGSYFFYDSRVPPKEQAQLWASMLDNDYGELDHCADYEERYGGEYGGWVNLYIFMERFQELTNLPDERVPIYTGYYYWLSSGKAPIGNAESMAWFKKHRLWLAWYVDDPAYVKIPQPWDAETLIRWQDSAHGNGPFYGVESGNIDMNKHVHGQDHYNEFYGLGTTSPQPPTEQDVLEFSVDGDVKGRMTGKWEMLS